MPTNYAKLAAAAAQQIRELMPWDVEALQKAHPDLLLLDVRERSEFAAARIARSLNVPRGILESAAEWDYVETEPELVAARDRKVIAVCRSGNRSALAALVLAQIGFRDIASMKLGVKGWNDADLPLVDGAGQPLDGDTAAALLSPPLREDQKGR
jgi:rhodanese-related sulfurtransferase